jgi:hypothetical protein
MKTMVNVLRATAVKNHLIKDVIRLLQSLAKNKGKEP